jgi:hypothetical protein
MKQELENLIKVEYPLIYENFLQRVLEKENRDFENKKELLDLYQQFSDIDVDRLSNTLTVADIKYIEEAPSLQFLFDEAKVVHPIEELLDTFKHVPGEEEEKAGVSDNSELDFSDAISSGVEDLYGELKSNLCSWQSRSTRRTTTSSTIATRRCCRKN